jgi:hypothetical protein
MPKGQLSHRNALRDTKIRTAGDTVDDMYLGFDS